MATTKSKSDTQRTKTKSVAPRASDEQYTLTTERRAALHNQAGAIGAGASVFPGRLRERIRHSYRIRTYALRDAADLVRTPFVGEPPLTDAEIDGLRDLIEFLRVTESEFQAARSRQAQAAAEFSALAAQAIASKNKILRAFDVRFRNDPSGQKRITRIRDGAGDPDLVQDVSDIIQLAGEYEDFLASCPNGESQAVAELRRISPELARLLGAKTISDEARSARLLRDGAYTLVQLAERKIRAAAEYWYGDTPKLADYANYVPRRGRSDGNDPEDGDEPEPAASGELDEGDETVI